MGSKIDFDYIRKRIKDKKSAKNLDQIKENYKSVIKGGKVIKDKKIFDIKIGRYDIWVRNESSAASIMTYSEIFKDKSHMRHPEFLGKGDKVVFDIGANEGFYTLKMKENNPRLKIVALEPVPSTFEMLKKNVNVNRLKDIVLLNKALTSKEGTIEFEIIPEVSTVCSTDISMQKIPWLDATRTKKIKVCSTTLSGLCNRLKINHIDILKLDVEGSELDILKGSKNFLPQISKIVIEWHSEKLKKGCESILNKNGFKLVHGENKLRGDIYFINKK